MPNLENYHSDKTTKLLFIGDSGSGKTGALASLAAAGYNLRILDLDNGLDVLKHYLTHPNSKYKTEKLKLPHYITLEEQRKSINGTMVPRTAVVWQKAMKLLDNWDDGESKFGPISSWTSAEVLVIDSLSLLCSAAMNLVKSMNGRLGQTPHQSDWYSAQQLVEGFVQTVTDAAIKCNVILNCHVAFIGDDNGPQHGYPETLGKALSPKIGRYFNSILLARTVGIGQNATKQIFTNSVGTIELKNTAPTSVAKSYPLETGLADYFSAVRGT